MNIQWKTKLVSKALSYAVLVSVVICFAVTPVFAGESVFEVGKKYHLEYLGIDGDVQILSKPDKFGWVKVKVLDTKFRKYIADEGYVNLSLAILAKEFK